MKARRIIGVLGIVVGLAGMVTVVMERRAAHERQRVLASLAEDFRKHDQPESRGFRPGDRVRIVKWAGTFKPEETGANVEVQCAPPGFGVVTGVEKEIVRVRWPAQRWQVPGGEEWLQLPQFEATIHASYLEVAR